MNEGTTSHGYSFAVLRLKTFKNTFVFLNVKTLKTTEAQKEILMSMSF